MPLSYLRPALAIQLLIGLLQLSSACSSLPAYAAPRGGMVDPDSVDRSDLIRYRDLRRDDFKAAAPPAEAAAHAELLGAMTCAYLLTTEGTKLKVVERRDADGSRFFATFDELGFVAYMDRNCSWWNPDEGEESEPYLLQHEQTHFALSELAARQLNARVPELIAELRSEGNTLQEAQSLLEEQLEEILSEAHDELLDGNHDFDEDTSAKHDPVTQQRWFDRVNRKLLEYGPLEPAVDSN